MASGKYPNNACCYYVSWDNVPLTAGLLVAENLVFVAICAFGYEPLTFLSVLGIVYLACKLTYKTFKLSCKSCCSYECDSEHCIKSSFEKTYTQINEYFDLFREFSHGPKAIILLIILLIVRSLNLSVLTIAYLIAMWSFIEPALIKFAGIPIRHMVQAGLHNNPLEEYFSLAYEMIPKASVVNKDD